MRSLKYFYDGVFASTGKEFVLTGLKSQFNNLAFSRLSAEDKRRLNDSIIHATVIKQDEPDDGESSIYFVFERLNTGGNQLQPQEIRAALYHGKFSLILHNLNENRRWRSLYGDLSPRRRDEELMLRFFSLYFNSENYEQPMKEFLNTFMGKNKNLETLSEDTLTEVFDKTISTVEECFGVKAFKPKKAFNAAVFDSTMVGIARRLERGVITDKDAAIAAYNDLLQNTEYVSLTDRATADRENVRRRIEIATEAFTNVQ